MLSMPVPPALTPSSMSGTPIELLIAGFTWAMPPLVTLSVPMPSRPTKMPSPLDCPSAKSRLPTPSTSMTPSEPTASPTTTLSPRNVEPPSSESAPRPWLPTVSVPTLSHATPTVSDRSAPAARSVAVASSMIAVPPVSRTDPPMPVKFQPPPRTVRLLATLGAPMTIVVGVPVAASKKTLSPAVGS